MGNTAEEVNKRMGYKHVGDEQKRPKEYAHRKPSRQSTQSDLNVLLPTTV